MADRSKIVISRLEDIPDDMSAEEEVRFWDEHQLGESLLDQMQPLHPHGAEVTEGGAADRR